MGVEGSEEQPHYLDGVRGAAAKGEHVEITRQMFKEPSARLHLRFCL
jgi:hypothetical protein